jgi:predicted Zn-dependent protease with MMP-like domain
LFAHHPDIACMSEPDEATFEAMARAAFARIPEPFAPHLAGIRVTVEDFADAETLAAVITLYRKPLLAEWQETGVRLEDLVAHVVIHEVGHHFGLSDEDMHAIEAGER